MTLQQPDLTMPLQKILEFCIWDERAHWEYLHPDTSWIKCVISQQNIWWVWRDVFFSLDVGIAEGAGAV